MLLDLDGALEQKPSRQRSHPVYEALQRGILDARVAWLDASTQDAGGVTAPHR